MSFTEYETAVIQKLKECVQFKHWTFDDLKESIYDDFEYCDDLKQFYIEGKSIQEAAERLDAWTWIFMQEFAMGKLQQTCACGQ